MNTLIKIIITTVLGIFGSLTEIEDNHVNFHNEQLQDIELISEKNGLSFCWINKKTCIMLKNKIDS